MHPQDHLSMIDEACSLFKHFGLSNEEVQQNCSMWLWNLEDHKWFLLWMSLMNIITSFLKVPFMSNLILHIKLTWIDPLFIIFTTSWREYLSSLGRYKGLLGKNPSHGLTNWALLRHLFARLPPSCKEIL
jgi:hypothetical protein